MGNARPRLPVEKIISRLHLRGEKLSHPISPEELPVGIGDRIPLPSLPWLASKNMHMSAIWCTQSLVMYVRRFDLPLYDYITLFLDCNNLELRI